MDLRFSNETMAHAWARSHCGYRRDQVPAHVMESADADMLGTYEDDQRWQFPDGSAVIYDPVGMHWDFGIHSDHFDVLALDNPSVWYRIEEGENNPDEYPAPCDPDSCLTLCRSTCYWRD